ncbi:hypothetical protein DPSP01_013486 [Paraphaeosphaeria sporulosa]|uniref:NAD(P)-binding domain-containing protein n=1 Tax=Paraphaeosphaeria sporulosa TaxID=1460663 RepID=A0A177BYF4_9PLEO|nr:uncharacterized protein CC84DRAFT_1103777 [Paraphaeosphaeria sporulosa]OAF99547.1 hypothetical protein CC84DRAFT_1103777 [Paraphaeosphaeria sporulosa]
MVKLIIGGATGFVATEVIRQSLSNPKITAIYALGRKPIAVPEGTAPGADTSKLKSLVVKDFEKYPEDVKAQLADADGAIWALAVLPQKTRGMPFEEVKKINQTYTLKALEQIEEARAAAGQKGPFRFLYISGPDTPRTPDGPTPPVFKEYIRLKGRIEVDCLEFAEKHKASGWEAGAAKPGLVLPNPPGLLMTVVGAVAGLIAGKIGVRELAAAMVDQVSNGFEKEPLENVDLARIGKKALEAQQVAP